MLSVSADGDRFDIHIVQHSHGGCAGTTCSAKDNGSHPRNIDTERFYKALESVVIGVVAIERAIFAARDGIDVTQAAGYIAHAGEIGDDGALIGDGDVEAFPFIAFEKGFELFGFALKTSIVKSSKFLVNGRGVGMA